MNKKVRLLTLIAVLVMLISIFAIPGSAQETSANYIVLFNNGNLQSQAVERQVSAMGGQLVSWIPQISTAVVSSSDANFKANAQASPGVQTVVTDYVVQFIDPDMQTIQFEGDVTNPPFTSDDDFFFDLQWGHDAVDALEAWDNGLRGAGVRVAVLDSGIDADHPDIAPNLNTALSASFVPGEDWNIRPGVFFNHGTHVAGTIAAADNGFGVIGVAPEAEIVAVKVLSEYTGSGAFSGVIAGIVYAADIDADIINMSLGAFFPFHEFGSEAAGLLNAMSRATTYATQQGTTVIASAGNDGADKDHTADWISLPADAANVLSISATAPFGWALDPANTFLDNLTYYSNYGQSAIDFAAPGGTVEYPGNELCTVAGLTRPCWVFDLVFSTSSGGWAWAQGTSMAAPHASGVAALIIGANGGDMKPAHVATALRSSADDLGKPGSDPAYGMGRVNAGNYLP